MRAYRLTHPLRQQTKKWLFQEVGTALAFVTATPTQIRTAMELNVLSQHEHALKFRAQRNQVLSSNIANADTPNYKARDFDFKAALKTASTGQLSLKTTSELHQKSWRDATSMPQAMYRIPTQPTLDGNTVEADVEQAAFAENTLMYRASLAFIDGQIRSLKFAIKGTD